MITNQRLALLVLLAVLAAMATMVHAAETPRRPGKAVWPAAVESCVSGDRIDFSTGGRAALLDPRDRVAVHLAILQRYPALLADAFTPAQIVLWRRQGGAWLYVTLLANPARPEELCFTATFTASTLDLTGALLEKYFAVK